MTTDTVRVREVESNPGGAAPSFRIDVQGLRAVAVLLVVAYHAGLPVPGGYTGVDVFIVVSGFVIMLVLQNEWRRNGRVSLGNFYLRRFKRLYPALAMTVVATVLVSSLILSPVGPQQTAAKTALGGLFLSSNIVIARESGDYFGADAATNPLLHMWSLSVEEQFYLIFPILLVIAWILTRGPRRIHRRVTLAVILGIIVISFGLMLLGEYLTANGASTRVRAALGFYSPVVRSWEFAAGALVAVISPQLRNMPRALGASLYMVGWVMLGAGVVFINDATIFPGLWAVLPVGGTVVLIAAGSRRGASPRVLTNTPMTRIGDWSYSVYLWHWPIIVFTAYVTDSRAALVVAATLSFIPAALSYYLLEQPIRKSHTTGRQFARLVAVIVVPPLFIIGSAMYANAQDYWNAEVAAIKEADAQHLANREGCLTTTPISQQQPGECTWNEDVPGRDIYLVGDSHADHISEAVVSAGERLQRPTTIAATNSCPFLPLHLVDVEDPTRNYMRCAPHFEETYSWLLEAPAGTVLISTTDSFFNNPKIELASTREFDLVPALDTGEKLLMYEELMTHVVKGLQDAGHEVILAQDTPRFSEALPYDPSACSVATIIRGECRQSIPYEDALATALPSRDARQNVADDTGAQTLDLFHLVCTTSSCQTAGPEGIRYRDGGHISVHMSESLTDAVADALTATS